MKKRVVISGFSTVSPFGIGNEILWENVSNGNSGAKLINSFDTEVLPVKFATFLDKSEIQLEEYIENQKSVKTLGRAGKFLIIAAQEAWEQSGIKIGNIDPFRVGTSIGSGGLGNWDVDTSNQILKNYDESIDNVNGVMSINTRTLTSKIISNTHPLEPLKILPNIPTAHVAIICDAKGSSQTLTTACVSSAQAIGEAFFQIQTNRADVMITGGSDSMINPNCIIMFSLLGVLSKNNSDYLTASRPFSLDRDGFMIGEGAAVFVLEELQHCLNRGGTPICEIIGYSSSSDAFRLTDPDPNSSGTIASMINAINDANIDISEIDYINSHGTGTKLNDKLETKAIKTVFGEKAYTTPISSTKSMIGHCVAAAGSIELAVCILSLKNNLITPTINHGLPDAECDLDYTFNLKREYQLSTIMTNSFGFGGQNVSLIIRKFYE